MDSGQAVRPRSLLVVSTDEAFVDACRRRLAPTPSARVSTAGTLEAAASSLRSADRLDAVVADPDSWRSDVVTLLQAVRAQHPTLPFFVVDDDRDDGLFERVIAAGVTEYRLEPADDDGWEELAALVDGAVTFHRDRIPLSNPQARVEAFLEGTNCCLTVVRDGAFVYVNARGASVLGLDTSAARVDEGVENVLGADVGSDPGERIDAVQRGDPSYATLDVRLRHHDGSDSAIDIAAVRIDWAGEPAVLVASHGPSDGGTWRSEPSLKRRAIEEAPIGITIADATQPDDPLIYANDRFYELTGYPEADVLGRNCRFLQGEETDPETVALMREAVAAEEPATVVVRNYTKGGQPFWNRVTIAPLENDDGVVTHFLGFQEDVTERREHEARLRQYERAIEGADELIAAIDEEYAYLFANEAYRTFHDLDLEAVSERTLAESIGGETFEIVEPYVRRAFDGETIQYRMVRRQPDRPSRHFDIRYYPFEGETDDVKAVVATMRDRTEQLEREHHLRALDRLLRHTLRNELNVILGETERLEERAGPETTELTASIQGSVDSILTQASKEREIVDVLSERSSPDQVSVNRLLDRLKTRLRGEHPNATVSVDVPSGTTLTTVPEVERAVYELLENAVVHSTADTPAVTVTATASHSSVTVAVEDDCPRISSEIRGIITTDAEIQPLLHNSGMGLWLVKRIVDRTGGELRFADAEEGNVVSLVLPHRVSRRE